MCYIIFLDRQLIKTFQIFTVNSRLTWPGVVSEFLPVPFT